MKMVAVAFCLALALIGNAKAQGIAALSAETLMTRAANKDTTFIINFWATWCGPCVAELPQFELLRMRYSGQKVKVLLVSLDLPQSYPGKLSSFVTQNHINPEVLWLNEEDAEKFIPVIYNEWSGALPGTLIIQALTGYKYFLQRPIAAKEIADLIDHISDSNPLYLK